MESKFVQVEILSFAEYVVMYYNGIGEYISNKKLNKILYYIQGWHLAYFGENIFKDIPEAWVHGPVYPDVYKTYKRFGNGNIDLITDETERSASLKKLLSFGFADNDVQSDFVLATLEFYGKKSATELEISSHRELPWLEARGNLKSFESGDTDITVESMRKYFTERLNKN